MAAMPFLWGAATSAHQVEGNNCLNDWWAWEQAHRVSEVSGAACEHYGRFREDFELVSRLGHKAHRFSLEWSRLEPRENQWDGGAFAHYEEVFRDLARRGIEPVVTLHHFTNPQWLLEEGGWKNERVVDYFSRYVRRVVEAYGRYVRFWITLNEPLIFLYFSYFEGIWPPGGKDFGAAMVVFRSLIRAHVAAYREIHRHYETALHRPAWVSVANHTIVFEPAREHACTDRIAVFLRDQFVNHLFFRSCRSGFLFFPGVFCEPLAQHSTLDFLGVNYYTRNFIRFEGPWGARLFGIVDDRGQPPGKLGERNQMGWEVYAPGLYRVLRDLMRYRLPIMICENGICASHDEQRARFLSDHLAQVRRARAEGMPVWGYLYWSLLDNFEWHHGFGPRFGILEVDYATQARKLRPSAQILTDICRQIENGP